MYCKQCSNACHHVTHTAAVEGSQTLALWPLWHTCAPCLSRSVCTPVCAESAFVVYGQAYITMVFARVGGDGVGLINSLVVFLLSCWSWLTALLCSVRLMVASMGSVAVPNGLKLC